MESNKKDLSLQWMVIYTKPRAEKKVAERLSKQGFEVYCPTYTTIRQWSDRKKKVVSPVVPSYVFIRIKEGQRWEVLKDPGVMNFVFWLGKPAVMRNESISAFRQFVEKIDGNSSVKYLELNEGDKVKVNMDNFQGTVAEVLRVEEINVILLLPELGMKLICEKGELDIL
ncbi:UpxY family transcription antiterminator [Algivirga pacifica]|uniref:UpxY family transcription antiterminator n=1 Tax=Algivirga pacifica TaxID=1162670 RepID=A0ABP9D4S9_9BACT